MTAYARDFYRRRHESTVYSAKVILPMVLEHVPGISSAVDVGCGVGTWLSVLKEMGVSDVQGIDGDWVDRSLLMIPRESFIAQDLTEPIRLQRRFDLAISLEVAEHLPQEMGEEFVRSLTRLSDFVLFSAAVPFQGGVNHLNEEWQDHWARIFESCGYFVYDFIRARIWNERRIPVWYRQNILLYARRSRSSEIDAGFEPASGARFPLNVVHPDLYVSKIGRPDSVGRSWRQLVKAIKGRLRRSRKGPAA